MAQPPRKRQRQLVVLSSSDTEENITNEAAKSPEKIHKPLTSRPRTIGALRSRQNATQASARNSPASSPKKSSKTAQTAKTKSSEQRSGSLYSFFNARTESQKALQSKESSQTKLQHLKAAIEVEDIIEDESTGDEQSISSQTQRLPPSDPAPLRKLSSHSTQTLKPSKQSAPLTASNSFLSQSQRFNRPSPRSDASSQRATKSSKDERPWAERYGPSNLEELAVHKKKVADVRGWIQSAFEKTHRHVSL